MLKWLGIIVGALVALIAIIAIIGALRPADHTASITVVLQKPRAEVWTVLADAEGIPSWFSEVKRVERLPDIEGQPAWREHFADGWAPTIVIRESVEGTRLVREIQPGGPFSGSWTMELSDDGAGTRLAITERGHVPNPLFRGMMIFMDQTKTMRAFATALAAKLATPAAFVQPS